MLVVGTDRRIQPFSERDHIRDRPRKHDARARQDDGEARLRHKPRGLGHGILATCGALEVHDLRQVDVDDLGPHVTRDIDLRRGRVAPCAQDHAVQNLGDARGVADLFLVTDAVGKEPHLLHLLETALTDVGGLRRHQ